MRLKAHGFTLVEILVVVTILAIAAVIAAPSLSNGYDSVRLPSAARMVMSDLLFAQNTAITQQKPVYVVLQKSGSTGQYTGYDLAINTISPTTHHTATVAGDWVWTADRGEWITRFGSAGDGITAPGALRSTQLKSVSLTTGQTLGFDSLGKPIIANGGTVNDATATITFEIANHSGTSSTKLLISPITGEMSISN